MGAAGRPKLPKQDIRQSACGKKKRLKDKLVIELPRSRKYIPNSGPTLGPITLAPPNDSTAYIIERILLPPEGRGKDGRPKPRRPTYIVGWRDMLGARLLVPVMDILDYASPWEVERWEGELEAELSAQKQKLEEEKLEAEETEALPALPNQPQPPQTKKRKRGRPPKNPGIETAAVTELETEGDGSQHLKGGALSFTPQKLRPEEFAGMSSAEATPSRQLEAEQGQALDSGTEADGEETIEDHETTEQGQALDFGTEADVVGMAEDFRTAAQGQALENGAETDGDDYGTAGDEMEDDDQPDNVDKGFGNAQGGIGSLPPFELQGTNPDVDLTSQATKRPKLEPQSQTTVSSLVTANTAPFKPVKSPAVDAHTNANSEPPKVARQRPQEDDTFEWPASVKGSLKAQKAKAQRRRSALKSSPRKRKRDSVATSEAQVGVDIGGEQQWIVQKIEDVELYDVEGVGLVRYFKVRWEGDWPPDQNPSWEPEENLPPALVRNYYKQDKKRWSTARKKKQKQKYMKQTMLSWGSAVKRYESVSQAFAGDGDNGFVALKEEPEDELASGIPDYTDNQDHDDELLVVDDNQGGTSEIKLDWGGQRSGFLAVNN